MQYLKPLKFVILCIIFCLKFGFKIWGVHVAYGTICNWHSWVVIDQFLILIKVRKMLLNKPVINWKYIVAGHSWLVSNFYCKFQLFRAQPTGKLVLPVGLWQVNSFGNYHYIQSCNYQRTDSIISAICHSVSNHSLPTELQTLFCYINICTSKFMAYCQLIIKIAGTIA